MVRLSSFPWVDVGEEGREGGGQLLLRGHAFVVLREYYSCCRAVSTKLEENRIVTFLAKRVEHYRILKYEYNTQKVFVYIGKFSHWKRVLETESAFTRTRFQIDAAVTTFRNRIKNAVSKHTKTI